MINNANTHKIYYIKNDSLCGNKDKYYSYLSKYRFNRIFNMKSQKRIRQSIMAELILQYAIATNTNYNVPYEYVVDSYGKPHSFNNDFYFSLSHSFEIAICVFSNYQVGIDIEKKLERDLKIITKVLNKDEQHLFNTKKPNNKMELFYKYWVIKESYLKYNGLSTKQSLINTVVDFENKKVNRIPFKLIEINNNFQASIVSSNIDNITIEELDDITVLTKLNELKIKK